MIPVRLEPTTFTDRRTKQQIGQDAALLQYVADQRLEREWRARVADNVRRRLAAKVVQLDDRRAPC